ncbi:hypothetical protein WJ967_08870 [Achromobacter xylosoxidans]
MRATLSLAWSIMCASDIIGNMASAMPMPNSSKASQIGKPSWPCAVHQAPSHSSTARVGSGPSAAIAKRELKLAPRYQSVSIAR